MSWPPSLLGEKSYCCPAMPISDYEDKYLIPNSAELLLCLPQVQSRQVVSIIRMYVDFCGRH